MLALCARSRPSFRQCGGPCRLPFYSSFPCQCACCQHRLAGMLCLCAGTCQSESSKNYTTRLIKLPLISESCNKSAQRRGQIASMADRVDTIAGSRRHIPMKNIRARQKYTYTAWEKRKPSLPRVWSARTLSRGPGLTVIRPRRLLEARVSSNLKPRQPRTRRFQPRLWTLRRTRRSQGPVLVCVCVCVCVPVSVSVCRATALCV